MSVTFRTNQIKLKTQDGTYASPVVIGDSTIAEHIAQVESAINDKEEEALANIEDVIESIPEEYTELTEQVTDLKSALDAVSENFNLFDPANYNVAKNETRYFYLNTSGNLVGATLTSGDARSVYIPIDSSKTYTVKKSTVTTMKIATFPSEPITIPMASGAKKMMSSASNNPLTITSGANDRWLLIQLFVDADSSELKSIEANVDSLVVVAGSEIPEYTATAVDRFARSFLVGSERNKNGKVYYGSVPAAFYRASSYEYGYNSSTLSSAIYNDLDDIVADFQNYVTKTNLGNGSDGYPIYEYDFIPENDTHKTNREIPKILIVSGQHGFEKASVFGLVYFIRDLLTAWRQSETLEYLRHNCKIMIIPIANRYGFDNNSYLNANGVNLNRNYDMPEFPIDPSAQPGDTTYGGASPFDQPETQYIKAFVEANLDAISFVDYHTNGQYAVANYSKINWKDFPKSTDEFFLYMQNIGAEHLRKISINFVKNYNLPNGTLCGYITGRSDGETTYPSADCWAYAQGLCGMTFEGFNGFPEQSAFTENCLTANAELIGNWIISIIGGFNSYHSNVT